MLEFLKRDGWSHDSIETRSVDVEDWDDLRGEEGEGVRVVLPPITIALLDEYDAAPDEFDAEDWLRDNLISHTTTDQDRRAADIANTYAQDPDDWLFENWRTLLTAEQITGVEADMAEAKEEHDSDAIEQARDNFKDSDSYYEWKDGFEPAMNFYWPVDLAYELDEETAAERIDKHAGATSLVWIERVQSHAIVLTGGGMDLSWDICAAYICCGCVPPARLLLGLPRFAGGGYAKFGELIVNTLIPLLVKHREWQAEHARDEAKRLVEHLKLTDLTLN